MAKVEPRSEYLAALEDFRVLISKAVLKMDQYADVEAIGVHIETGRKFDKIVVSTVTKKARVLHESKAVTFFVAKSTFIEKNGTTIDEGSIYGKKSDVAPNFRWYFGDIFHAAEWNWTAAHPVPKPSYLHLYKLVSSYGDIKHYQKQD